MSKNITEVMAATFFNEFQRQAGIPTRWDDLPATAQAVQMSAMAEVTRTLKLFGIFVGMDNGKPVVYRRREDVETKRKVLPINSPSNKLDGREAKMMGFCGEQCPQCNSFKTIRNGTCITCTECLNSGECG